MNWKLGFALAGIFFIFSCSDSQKESKKNATKKPPVKENKELSQDSYKSIVGEWRAKQIAETPEEPLTDIPGKAEIYLIIREDRTFYTLFNIDTVTSGNYTIKEEQVVFNEKKNFTGRATRFLSCKVKFEGDQMELEGEWVENDGSKEYHHSTFRRSTYNVESIITKLDSLEASK
ncbi:MAG: hypothetical protein KDC84_08970 [Crocinitomicaceae bacterium]|nr:hypothetical protein [Crocinitomicaceae bacterium]